MFHTIKISFNIHNSIHDMSPSIRPFENILDVSSLPKSARKASDKIHFSSEKNFHAYPRH